MVVGGGVVVVVGGAVVVVGGTVVVVWGTVVVVVVWVVAGDAVVDVTVEPAEAPPFLFDAFATATPTTIRKTATMIQNHHTVKTDRRLPLVDPAPCCGPGGRGDAGSSRVGSGGGDAGRT